MSTADVAMLADQAVAAGFIASVGEAFRQGVGGLAVDLTVQGKPWLFEPGTITAPTRVLHGEADHGSLSRTAGTPPTSSPTPSSWFSLDTGTSVSSEKSPSFVPTSVPRRGIATMSVSTSADLWCMSAMDLAAVIRSRQASSQDVIEAHLRRIEAVELRRSTPSRWSSASRPSEPRRQPTVRWSVGKLSTPLHGVPFTIKENIDLAGTPTTQGARALADAYPTQDAPVVERLRAAGAIPIGRTNIPKYGVGWDSDNALRGATVNPWDRSRTPGASSGGEAVALAAGLSPLGLGNEGSGRCAGRSNAVVSAR